MYPDYWNSWNVIKNEDDCFVLVQDIETFSIYV